jgi:hypothetical protein
MYAKVLLNVLAVNEFVGIVPMYLATSPLRAESPTPKRYLNVNPVVLALKDTKALVFEVVDRRLSKATRSVASCGIDVNSIEVASAPKVFVSIRVIVIRRLLRKD